MHSYLFKLAVTIGSLAAANAAVAHPGHSAGLVAGIAHPLFGLDHALAMLAVGLWAYQLGGRATLAVPAAFVALMALGGGLAFMGIALPAGELGISVSVLLLGMLVMFAIRLSPGIAAAIAGTFAVFHGYAHGIEIPMPGEQWSYAFGFMVATALLHLAGIAVAAMLGRTHALQRLQRTAGMSIAAAGAWLVAGVLA